MHLLSIYLMQTLQKTLILLIMAVAGVLTSAGQHMMIGSARIMRHSINEKEIPSDSLIIKNRVVESLAKRDLTNAFMIPIDSDGNPGDTIKARPEFDFVSRNLHRTKAYVSFMTGRMDSTYIFEIGCPGYITQTISYKVDRVGKRETEREMPMTVLERVPYELKELEVVASKVKFYHNGDTLVYNADAFQLPDGSMLDELIRQLPGVELSSDGVIKVNGDPVETLLLNGKHFFKGNNKLMLENLGAYTVDKVKVYRGQTAVEKWIGDPNAEKHLTMDVKLKKEYSTGYILNTQGGAGTEDRYLGNLFASWFSNLANISLVGNINNVGDFFGLHGAEDSWRPPQTSKGDNRRQSLGLNYDVETKDFNRTAHGSITYSGDRFLSINNGNSATYYTDSQVFGYQFARSTTHNMNLRTSHNMMFVIDRVNISADISGNYSDSDALSSSLSASFNEEQADITQEALETIYGDGSVSALAALVNRNRNIGDRDSKRGGGNINTTARYKVPGTSDIVTLTFNGTYTSSKSTSWSDYAIDFGDKSKPSEKRRQYTDNSPNNNLNLSGACTYTARIGKVSLDLAYKYGYSRSKSDSYLYELQQLADMGDFGVLPPDYQSAFSPANSYISENRTNTHAFSPSLRYELKFNSNRSLSINISPELSVSRRHLDYWRDNRWYNIRHTSSLVDALSGRIMIYFRPNAVMAEKGSRYSLSYMFSTNAQLPSLMSLVDITDDSNPLYIQQGNPDLKASRSYNHNFSWSFGKKAMNTVSLMYSYTTNSMTHSSTYDMKTGITRSRAENINGNNSLSVYDNIFWYFGKNEQFSLNSNTSVSRTHSVELMSTNGAEPVRNSANTWSIGEDLRLDWRINGRHRIGVSCRARNQRTNSNREGFNKVNNFNINYGLTGSVNLPAGFEIGTSFSLYTRRGYGSKELDTTDALWNANASYITKNRRWVFMVNAYDLLHQISNVHYNVTATGRISTYSNALPSYVIATVQFRFNRQPKNKK